MCYDKLCNGNLFDVKHGFAVTVITKLSTCWLLGSIFHLGSSYASVLIIIIVTCDTTT